MKVSRGNFWGITLLGCMVLFEMATRLFRSSTGPTAWDYFEWALDAALVVAIWFAYRRQLRVLDELAPQIEQNALARISGGVNYPPLAAYVALLHLTIAHIHRH
jgi:hypothetical protein